MEPTTMPLFPDLSFYDRAISLVEQARTEVQHDSELFLSLTVVRREICDARDAATQEQISHYESVAD